MKQSKTDNSDFRYSPSTKSVHAGTLRDPLSGGVNTPIFPSSAIDYRTKDIRYPRNFNTPNNEAVAQKLAALEGTEKAVLFSTGMAAISIGIMALVKPGDHIVFQKDLYGGTLAFIDQELPKRNISYTFVDATNIDELKEAITEQTTLIYIETPSNPLLTIIDIKSVTNIAKDCRIKTMIDNTFASPINQNPAQLGCDLIMHSATKYLGGHSDFCAGALAGSLDIIEQCRLLGTMYGCSLNASDLSLLERSMKTLAIRVEKQNYNALEIAHYLHNHPAISKVYYPGLITHPGYTIEKEQMHGFGGMMSFELNTEKQSDIDRFLDSLNIIIPAGSLGGVESLITSPALTSHKLIGENGRQSYGIKDNLLRLSVGIENIEDLINDLSFALKNV